MTVPAPRIAITRRPWAALLALLGMLFVATATAPLPAWVGDLGTLCSAQGATDLPDGDGHGECCVLCAAGHLAGPLPEPLRLTVPGHAGLRLAAAAAAPRTGRTAHSAQARAPPSV